MPTKSALHILSKLTVFKHQTGFTLVELLVVVVVITILTGIGIPAFSSYLNRQSIRQANEQVKDDLRTIQNRAIAGTGFEEGYTFWGIYFTDEQNQYETFATDVISPTACPPSTSYENRNSRKMVNDIRIKNGSACVYFSMNNADAVFYKGGIQNCTDSGGCLITVGYDDSTGNNCDAVYVNNFGRIWSGIDQTCL